MTITRYRKGQLSVPLLYTPLVDTIAGNLTLRQEGSIGFAMDGSYLHAYKHLRLVTAKNLLDQSLGILIGTDDLGNIDDIGRIDGALTTPADAHAVTVTPSELINKSQGGTINEDTGYWSIAADDALYMYLGRVLDFQHVNGTVRIDTITVFFNTNHNDVYINQMDLHQIDVTTGGLASAKQDLTNHGEGGTGNDNVPWAIDVTLVTGKVYRLMIGCEATSGTLIIRALTIEYHLV